MSDAVDVAVIGAGPAGMAAACAAAAAGLSVAVLDDQPAPGGQVWRAAEAVAARGDLDIFGADYAKGVAAVARFRAASGGGIDYRPLARAVGVEDREDAAGGDVLYVREGAARRLACRSLVIATGAYERPMPFRGWTLPGVMTLGAAQIAMKTADLLPARPYVLAGQGPLLLLLVAQLRRAGAAPDLILRLDDPARRVASLAHGPKAAALGPDYLLKGLRWAAALGSAVRNVVDLAAEGDGRLERVAWRTADGAAGSVEAACLLIHDGVLPNAQLTRAMRAPHVHDARAAAWRPEADPATGRLAGRDWVHVAGDCAGIAGWAAAEAAGALAGAAAATRLGQAARAPGARLRLARARAVRPLLDALYPPARAFAAPADDVLVCRCEAQTAGDVRAAARLGAQGPNQLKAFTRAGMGPCQGRMCATTVARLLAAAQDRDVADVGLMRVRMPISPVTIGEMSALDDAGLDLPRT